MNTWKHPYYGEMPVLTYNNSMGLVRYVLAAAVLIAHFNEIFSARIYFPVSSYDAVGAFFALSGFLLYGSYMKDPSLKKYARKRAKRILPPYVFIVLLCTFGLSLTSSLGTSGYFGESGWVKYLFANLAFLNFLEPDLPGVFDASAIHAVNGSLWTMKVEVMLYCTVPAVLFLANRFFVRRKPHNSLMLFVVIYVLSMCYRLAFAGLYEITQREIYFILGKQFFGQLMYFYSGVFIYFIYRSFRNNRWTIIIVALILCVAGNYIPYYSITAGPAVVACLTVALSSFEGGVSIFNRNNLSYDIYLFHFPIIQLVFCYGESLNLTSAGSFLLVCGCVIALSLFSWLIIEKPILKKSIA